MKNRMAMVTSLINLCNKPKPTQPSSKLLTTSYREMRKKSRKNLFSTAKTPVQPHLT
jgi:hypothetical protein